MAMTIEELLAKMGGPNKNLQRGDLETLVSQLAGTGPAVGPTADPYAMTQRLAALPPSRPQVNAGFDFSAATRQDDELSDYIAYHKETGSPLSDEALAQSFHASRSNAPETVPSWRTITDPKISYSYESMTQPVARARRDVYNRPDEHERLPARIEPPPVQAAKLSSGREAAAVQGNPDTRVNVIIPNDVTEASKKGVWARMLDKYAGMQGADTSYIDAMESEYQDGRRLKERGKARSWLDFLTGKPTTSL